MNFTYLIPSASSEELLHLWYGAWKHRKGINLQDRDDEFIEDYKNNKLKI